jgi:hypothetical protein
MRRVWDRERVRPVEGITDDLQKIWKEVAVAHTKFRHFSESTEENYGNLSRHETVTLRHSNLAYSEKKSTALPPF